MQARCWFGAEELDFSSLHYAGGIEPGGVRCLTDLSSRQCECLENYFFFRSLQITSVCSEKNETDPLVSTEKRMVFHDFRCIGCARSKSVVSLQAKSCFGRHVDSAFGRFGNVECGVLLHLYRLLGFLGQNNPQ